MAGPDRLGVTGSAAGWSLTRSAGRALPALAGAVVAVLLAALTAAPAAAHDVLEGSSPSDGQRVARTPAAVVLTFDEPAMAMGTRIVVSGPAGEIQVGQPRLVDNTVTQPLQAGAPAGAYTVSWRVTSADGHPVTGAFRFTSRAAGSGAASPSPTAGVPTGTSSTETSSPAPSSPGTSSHDMSSHATSSPTTGTSGAAPTASTPAPGATGEARLDGLWPLLLTAVLVVAAALILPAVVRRVRRRRDG